MSPCINIPAAWKLIKNCLRSRASRLLHAVKFHDIRSDADEKYLRLAFSCFLACVLWGYGQLHRNTHKLAWYRKNGVESYESGGGECASLIVTEDDANGGIDAQEIARIVKKIWG